MKDFYKNVEDSFFEAVNFLTNVGQFICILMCLPIWIVPFMYKKLKESK